MNFSRPSNISLFLGLIIAISTCYGQVLVNNQNFDLYRQSWKKFEAEFDNTFSSKGPVTDALLTLFKLLKSSSFPTAVANLSNQKCVNDSQLYVNTLYSLTGSNASWARQMYESSGDYLPLGFFGGSGNTHSDGLFDECLAIRGPEETNIKGKYCSVFLSLAPVIESEILPFDDSLDSRASMVTIFQLINRLLGGLTGQKVEPKVARADATSYAFPSTVFCLPSSCTADDLGQAVAQLIGTNVLPNNYSILTITDEGYCFEEKNDPPKFDGADISVIVTLSLIGFLVLLATLHDAWRAYQGIPFDGKSDATIVTVLHCFSLFNNGRKLLSMKVSSRGTNLGCIHGIRVLSTLWVVIGHTWIYGPYLSAHNLNDVTEDGISWWFQGIGNGTVSVDTFFLMSGLLVSFLLLRELDRSKGKFNVALFYLHRYLRLTPVYAIILGFIATLMVYVGTGPYWPLVVGASNACRVSWWKNLLYIQNLWPTSTTGDLPCMGQTWYLSVDMQLFIIAPIFVYLLWRWPIPGLISLTLANLASIAANFAVFSLVDLTPTIMLTRTSDVIRTATNADYYYDLPWTRAPPYFIGIYVGWYLYKTEGSDRKSLNKIFVAFNWIISMAIFGAVLYGLVPYLDETTVPEIPKAVTIMYGSLHRLAWAVGVSWVIFACVRGYGGIFVNKFLSWKGFMPLGRLTYCVYLIHYDYLNLYFAWNRKRLYYTFMSSLTTYFGITVTVFVLAFLVSATIESSFLNLEKFLFDQRIRKDKGNEATSPVLQKISDLENQGNTNNGFNNEENDLNDPLKS